MGLPGLSAPVIPYNKILPLCRRPLSSPCPIPPLLPLPLVIPLPHLDFQCDDLTHISLASTRPFDFLSTDRAFGWTFTRLGALVLSGYEGFHQAFVAEEMSWQHLISLESCQSSRKLEVERR